MSYPSGYNGSKFTKPVTCNCGTNLSTQADFDAHVTTEGYCGKAHPTKPRINGFLAANFAGQHSPFTQVVWQEKTYNIGTCKACKRQPQLLSLEVKSKVGSAIILLVEAGICRLCIQTQSEEMEKVASQLRAAWAGGNRK